MSLSSTTAHSEHNFGRENDNAEENIEKQQKTTTKKSLHKSLRLTNISINKNTSLISGVEVIKLCLVLGAQKSCSKHEIQHFDWLIFEYEYKKLTRKFYDRKAWYLGRVIRSCFPCIISPLTPRIYET